MVVRFDISSICITGRDKENKVTGLFGNTGCVENICLQVYFGPKAPASAYIGCIPVNVVKAINKLYLPDTVVVLQPEYTGVKIKPGTNVTAIAQVGIKAGFILQV